MRIITNILKKCTRIYTSSITLHKSQNNFKIFVKNYLTWRHFTLKSTLNLIYEFKVLICDRKDRITFRRIIRYLNLRKNQEIMFWKQLCNVNIHFIIFSPNKFWGRKVHDRGEKSSNPEEQHCGVSLVPRFARIFLSLFSNTNSPKLDNYSPLIIRFR